MKKTFIILNCFIVTLFMIGCAKKINLKQYNCVLYNNVNESFTKSFLEQHITYGSYYNDILYNDTNLPQDYIIVIDSQNKADEIFNNLPFEIDFNEQNAIIYIYTANYALPCKLTGIEVTQDNCQLYVKQSTGPIGTGTVTSPWTRILIITMDKTSVTNYNIVFE